MGEDLYSLLRAVNSLPMHMPGHKRNAEKYPWLFGCGLDLTEIEGLDNLNDPRGVFKVLELMLAELRGAERSFALVNGSTAGVLAAVRTVMLRGGRLVMARNSHLSAYHAAELAGCPVSYAYSRDYASLRLEDLPEDTAAVFVTSPTYEGIISDIRSLTGLCHKRGVPLIVDEAHGAHLGMGGFPESAVQCGADIVVESLHKTLPSLTQTAAVHVRGGLVDPEELERELAVFQSSSPSYILSASIDGCVRYLSGKEGRADLAAWRSLLDEVRAELPCLWRGGEGVFALDPSKLTVFGDGNALGLMLRRAGIEPEYFDSEHLVLMTGTGDTSGSLERVAAALRDVPFSPPPMREPVIARAVMSPSEALRAKRTRVPAEKAAGRTAADYVWSYPPGVPLIAPGELITPELCERLGVREVSVLDK